MFPGSIIWLAEDLENTIFTIFWDSYASEFPDPVLFESHVMSLCIHISKLYTKAKSQFCWIYIYIFIGSEISLAWFRIYVKQNLNQRRSKYMCYDITWRNKINPH